MSNAASSALTRLPVSRFLPIATSSGTPAGTKWPTRRSTRSCTPAAFATATRFAVSTKRM